MAIQTNFPALRPTLNQDFAGSRTVDPRITFTRSSTATYFDAKGVLRTAASGVPRIDHDPATGECKGLLIEEARTNSIPNNTMQGAVIGSPGTTPTGWLVSGTGSGLTRSVVATGEEDGIGYIDIRFNGTPTVNNVSFSFAAANAIAAASEQAWALSVYLRLVGGSFANTTPMLDILETDGTSGVGTNQSACDVTSAPLATQRFVNVTTVDVVGTTHVQPRIRVGLTIGQPVDFTLRIGLPQFEAGVFATSVIPTTSAAATRAADVASMSGTNFSEWYRQDEGTFVVEYILSSITTNCGVMAVSDGTTANRMIVRGRSTGATTFIGVRGGATQYIDDFSSGLANVSTLVAFGYKTNAFVGTRNGAAPITDVSCVVPTVSMLRLGADGDGVFPLNGHIRSLRYYPKRLSNSELQTITA